MNLKILGIILGVVQILLAIWYFDWNSWNQILVSALLFLGAINVFLTNPQSKFSIQVIRLTQIIAVTIVFILLLKLLFVG